jgi:tRNA pseudouridine55 synthase
VRALAADLGAALGCGAHLAALRRVEAGPFDVARAVTLPALDRIQAAGREALLLPADCLLAELPRIDVPGDEAARLCAGQAIAGAGEDAEWLRAYDHAGRLLGVVRRCGGLVLPRRMARPVGGD